MTPVLDASVVLKLLVPEEDSAAAEALLDAYPAFFAPPLLRAEVPNSLWKRVRRGLLSDTEAQDALDALESLPFRYVEPQAALALELALILRHPVYDCQYLALALERQVTLITADRRFLGIATAGGHGEVVTALS